MAPSRPLQGIGRPGKCGGKFDASSRSSASYCCKAARAVRISRARVMRPNVLAASSERCRFLSGCHSSESRRKLLRMSSADASGSTSSVWQAATTCRIVYFMGGASRDWPWCGSAQRAATDGAGRYWRKVRSTRVSAHIYMPSIVRLFVCEFTMIRSDLTLGTYAVLPSRAGERKTPAFSEPSIHRELYPHSIITTQPMLRVQHIATRTLFMSPLRRPPHD